MMWNEAASGTRFGVLCKMVQPLAAKMAPTSAPRAISRIGSTWGRWRAAGSGRSQIAAERDLGRAGKRSHSVSSRKQLRH